MKAMHDDDREGTVPIVDSIHGIELPFRDQHQRLILVVQSLSSLVFRQLAGGPSGYRPTSWLQFAGGHPQY